jgi:RNA polymerase sigma factor (sigma-70 family)
MSRNRFPTTRWSRVCHASDSKHPHAQAALSELLELYQYPIYAFLRRESGLNHPDAEDLTQSFFVEVLENHTLQKADRAKGRFRTFVIGCVKRLVADDYRRRARQKRGGTKTHIQFDALSAEERYGRESVDDLSPEQLFERKLALEVFGGAMKELELETGEDGKAEVFKALRDRITDPDDRTNEKYREISARLNINVATLKSHTHRFRRRLMELLHERVDHIVASQDEVKEEMLALEDSLCPAPAARAFNEER